MNENNPIPPQLPPQYSSPPPLKRRPEPGDTEEERVPITNPIAAIEAVLRQPRRLMYQMRQPGSGPVVGYMILVTVICALVYGVVVGSFSMHEQLWRAPVKVAGGLLFSTVICLPSLYIFACLSGSQARLVEVIGMVAGMLMLTTILLVGFAPVAWIFSQSTESVNWMGTLHLIFWFIAAIFGFRFLGTAFSYSNASSSAGFNTWVAIFMLVILQMTTALRPIVGTSDTFFPAKKQFFLSHWSESLNLENTRNGQWQDGQAR